MNKIKFIAEIGGNHMGDYEKAKQLVENCIKTDVEVIKLQLYTAKGLVNEKYDNVRHHHFKKFELTKDEYIKLAKLIRSSGKQFCASVWDIDMMDWISDYVDIWKIGSGDFTSLPLISKVLDHGKPTILSTGLSNFNEVKKVIEYCTLNHDINQLLLMQCTSMYPIPDSEVNLSVINTYKDNFNVSLGYSDHTIGIDALKSSLSMNIEAVEFHYTLNKTDTSFRDNLVSLDYNDVRELSVWRDKVSLYMGSSIKCPTLSEISSGHINSFRRSVYANKKIKKGEIINTEDIILLRPFMNGSLSPLDLNKEFTLTANKDYDYLDLI